MQVARQLRIISLDAELEVQSKAPGIPIRRAEERP
jgi:hypothetical protein